MTRPSSRLGTLVAILIWIAVSAAMAQQGSAPSPSPYVVGNRLGLPILPDPAGTFNPISTNVKVFGSIYAAESCSYDPSRNLIVVPSRGVPQDVQVNNGWVSLINHDGSIHTARWIGVQNPGDQRTRSKPPAHSQRAVRQRHREWRALRRRPRWRDRSERPDPFRSFAVSRWRTAHRSARSASMPSTGFNDIAVAREDGTIYATSRRVRDARPDVLADLENLPRRARIDLLSGAPLQPARTASRSTSRATSWWSTSATPTC